MNSVETCLGNRHPNTTYPTIAIVANGAIDDFQAISTLIQSYSYLIAADGGLNYCHQMGLSPNLIIGDGDSIDQEIYQFYQQVPYQQFPKDKNESDTELAIKLALTLGAKKIALFGALGKRVDHLLANLHLLSRYPQLLVIESEIELIFCIQQSQEISCIKGQTISFLPLAKEARGVSSKGLKWNLQESHLSKDFFSLSNSCLSESISITIEEGDLICILQKLVR